MDLRHIKYFLAVAEEKHLGNAAIRLHISQPPLTRQIKNLETELGVVLFNRTPKGMELTEAGELFKVEAQNIQSVIQQATERTQRAGKGQLGCLDVAIFGSGILDTIPILLLAFRKAYPDVTIALHTMGKNEQIEALRQRRINVGFNRILPISDDFESMLVTTEKLLIAINTNDPLSEMDEIPLKQLQDHPFILFPSDSRPNFADKITDLCIETGFTPQVTQIVGDAVTSISLVASGFGVCLVPESATTLTLPHVVYKPIVDLSKPACVDLSCIFRANDKSPILKAFLDTIESCRHSGLLRSCNPN